MRWAEGGITDVTERAPPGAGRTTWPPRWRRSTPSRRAIACCWTPTSCGRWI
ncbi:MAG: hypothetical protein MZW92_42790 [Comamonadaceae bacterium]|nr:hypothetical protein [Comamonadaceae bacterium]